MSATHFAGRLRELREIAGLTQQQLAERAELTRDGIAQLETGRRKPSWETVVVLSDALGVSCEEFRKPPGEQPERKAGRPAKQAPAPTATSPAKKPRGRPIKDSGQRKE